MMPKGWAGVWIGKVIVDGMSGYEMANGAAQMGVRMLELVGL